MDNISLSCLQAQVSPCPAKEKVLRFQLRRHPIAKRRAPKNAPVTGSTLLNKKLRVKKGGEHKSLLQTFPLAMEINSYVPWYKAGGCSLFSTAMTFRTIIDACPAYLVTCFCSSHSITSPAANIRGYLKTCSVDETLTWPVSEMTSGSRVTKPLFGREPWQGTWKIVLGLHRH